MSKLVNALMEADTFFVTAIARMTDRHWPDAANVTELCNVEQLPRFPALYSQDGRDTSLTVAFVAKFFGKTACVEVWTTFAMLMNQTAIGKGWTIFRIQLRRRAVSDDMRDGRRGSYAGLADNTEY